MNIKFLAICLIFANSLYALDDRCSLAPEALKVAEEIRGLSPKRAVPCKVKDKAQVLTSLNQIIEREVTPEKIKNEELIFKKLKVIPNDFNYKEGLLKLYTSQLAGFYDPIEEYYVTASWLPEIMQTPIAVHELVHALQDQHYNLDDFIDSKNLAKKLRRPCLFPVPRFIIKLVLGSELTEHILANQSINSDKIKKEGFSYSEIITNLN